MAVEKIGNYNIHQNPATNENQFDVENYLNENWNKTKEVVNNNANELISVQGRVSALETDNTTNKQDISEIKEEQIEQNTNIESLQTKLEKVEKEFNDYAIHGQASGEFMHLTDSAKSSCKVDLKGNTKQETRTGKNLFNIETATMYAGTKELTSDKTGFILRKSTNRVNNYALTKALQAGTYTIYFKLKIENSTFNQQNVGFSFKNLAQDNVGATVTATSNETYALKVTTDQEVSFLYCFINNGENANCVATITDFMILEGEHTNDESYEKYGASPSLDYPSEIETLKDSVKVTACSANELDLTKLTITEKPNIEIDNISANEVMFHAINNTATSYYLRFKTTLKEGTYYLRKLYEMLEGTAVSGNNGSGVMFISKSDWSKEFVRLYANSERGSFTLTEDTEVFITLMLAKSENGKIRFYNLILSKDDVDFVKHEQNSVTVPIQQEMLTNDYLDKTNKKEVHNFRKIILDETQNYTLLTTTENYLRFMLDLNKTSDLKNGFKVYCENLKVVKQTTSNSVNEEKIIERDISLDKQLQIVILKSRLAEPTVEGLKQYLATNNIVAYCELEEPTKLDLTQEQIEVLEKLDEMQTYKNITNITTDSIAILNVDYKKDLETWQKQQDDRITALEELLNTTQTSAMLIENLENDLLKEVE